SPQSREHLLQECAITFGYGIDCSTLSNYSSTLNSYLSFCKSHTLPIKPSSDTLSLYIIFMSHYVKTSSISTYLSSIVHELEPYYPTVREACNSPLVTHSLYCSQCHFHHSPQWNLPLPLPLLSFICTSFCNLLDHNDLLCVAILVTAFYGLLCLGELILLDNTSIRDPCKITCHTSTTVLPSQSYQFTLPMHKADRLFEAEHGVSSSDIQHINCWASGAFKMYIQQHPTLIALLCL
ncbi:hypothetical protein BDQ17DRAFT_1196212, partial [Cyathus striatus]